MSSAAYTPLPTTTNGYPPRQSSHAILSKLTQTAPPTRIRRLLIFAAVLLLSSALVVYFTFSPSSLPDLSTPWSSNSNSNSNSNSESTYTADTSSHPSDNVSPFFRDTHPAFHARLFLARAQAQIKSRSLDTCNGKLSSQMIDAYLDNAVPYCTSLSPAPPLNAFSPNEAAITCFPAGSASPRSSPNNWWPYPQAFCTSHSLAHTPGWGGPVSGRGLFTGRCKLGDRGTQLKKDMGREVFLGTEFVEDEKAGSSCSEMLEHPVLFVPRQDRWNPFHVGEDIVTTFLALTLFSRLPSASSSEVSSIEKKLWESPPTSDFTQLEHALQHTASLQLMFQDEYLPTASLFAPLYDRIGAFRPRRMAAEGFDTPCLTRAFHSVGAGASLLSATGVGRPFTCASELVWGTSMWVRWIWGLDEDVAALGALGRRGVVGNATVNLDSRAPVTQRVDVGDAIQVLFLSRAQFDEYTRHSSPHGGLTGWQDARHIDNEGALVEGLRKELRGLCRVETATRVGGEDEDEFEDSSSSSGTHDCAFTDADRLPEAWGLKIHPREARALGLKAAPPPGGAGAPPPAAQGHGEAGANEGGEGSANDRRSPSSPNSNSPSPPTLSPRSPHPRALRFSVLDPTTAALPLQLGAVGRADVVISVHAGALGLMLMMPTGRASVVELMTSGAMGNWHFHNMAHMLGMEYVRVDVQRTVDVGKVVKAVREVVERRLAK
ncbi:hypothetical protein R3P38DRAFT_2603832 [Favolaschia claudopus]|uniref:Uncharacterized protein n=1 Tax=Favolaschia claudopus TaxID=2862362 RepID=A0AAW0DMP3_9AGAR